MKSPVKASAKPGYFNLFFLEMIIVLLFFCIAAVVILRTFAVSDRLARESRRTESMAFCAQSAAELYSETYSIAEAAEEMFGISGMDNASQITIPLNERCVYAGKNPALFMTMSETRENMNGGVMFTLYIDFKDADGEIVYQVSSGAYKSNSARDGVWL
ncbi:MAG: hypothetical protein J1E40_05575 [Oscillospiraceae bacterium]|nr:hypothetical protein [Oscillospiraceae bacterium]